MNNSEEKSSIPSLFDSSEESNCICITAPYPKCSIL